MFTDKQIKIPETNLVQDILKLLKYMKKCCKIHRKVSVTKSFSCEIEDVQPAAVLEKQHHRCFLVNIANFFSAAIYTRPSEDYF